METPGRPRKRRVQEPAGDQAGADVAARSAVDPTEGGVVGGGGEEEPRGRAGAGVGGGETEARAVGEVGLAVETPSHVRLDDDGEGRMDGAGERRLFWLVFLSPSFSFPCRREVVDGGVARPATRTDSGPAACKSWLTPLALAGTGLPRNSFNLLASPNFKTYGYKHQNSKPYSYSPKVSFYLSIYLPLPFAVKAKELMDTFDRLLEFYPTDIL